MTTETPMLTTPTIPSERAALRTLAERRHRVVRSVLVVVVVTLVLLVLSVLNRDEQALVTCRERMEYAVNAFQQHYNEGLRSPSELPLPPPGGGRDHFLYNWFYTNSYRPEVGVCCCREPHARLFRPAGRHVIVFNVERQEFRLEWMKEAEFAQQADDLGLRVLVQP